MAIFIPKTWVNLFGKISVFRLFELLVFIAEKGVFFLLEYLKRHFPGLYCLKIRVGKMVIFIPKSRVNLFGKNVNFSTFKLYVFIGQKGVVFVLEDQKRHLPCLFCLKKKFERQPFLDQNHGLTPLEKCQFFDFLNFLFLLPRKAFFRSRIS